MLKLRPYQEQLIDDARQALRSKRKILLQAPTGSGKTAITVFMMSRAAEQGKKAMFIVHQNELLSQTSRALWQQKLEHGMIASGKVISQLPVQVASVQTLVNRLPLVIKPDLIIIDEAHRSAASTYQKVLDYYPDAMVIGLTATPERTDGKGLNDLFNGIVTGPTIKQLMDDGFLCRYEIFAPKIEADFSTVKTTAGDYNKGQLAEALDKPTITGDAVRHYQQLTPGKRCVVMCATIKHAEHVAERYNDAGVPAVSIDGGMTNQQREAVINKFAAGEIKVICNVQLLIEGVDIPAIEVVQWLRPTKSLIVFMQGNGRGLRPAPGKEKLIILDHVENWQRHGLPCDDREWSLEGKKKSSRKKQNDEPDVNVQQCKTCFAVFLPGPDKCPYCGASIEQKKPREIQEQDGTLEKINLDMVRKEARKEQGQARTLKDLVELGMRRGMAKASQWACITACARAGRKPTPADFNEARQIFMELQR